MYKNVRRFTTNEGGFARVKSTLESALLTILCEDTSSSDEVFWSILADRKY